MKAKSKKTLKRIFKCQDCGKADETVKLRICPFAKEVHNEIVKVRICNSCEYERAMDI